MKRLLLLGALLFLSGASFADDVFKSTNVATNVQNIRQFVGRGTLKRVVVGVAGGTGHAVDLWDGTSTTNFIRKIGSLTSTSIRQADFDVAISSGLVFSSSGTATPATIQIIYKSGSGL